MKPSLDLSAYFDLVRRDKLAEANTRASAIDNPESSAGVGQAEAETVRELVDVVLRGRSVENYRKHYRFWKFLHGVRVEGDHIVYEAIFWAQSPVPNSPYERTKKDFEELKYQKKYETTSETVLPDFGVPQKIAHGQDTVTFTRRTYVGLYSLAVDIHYGFGLGLPFLFTKNETCRAMAVPKLQPNTTSVSESMFFNKLPKELRDRIYLFAVPIKEWNIGDVDSSNELDFAEGIGDLSGFYFPLSSLAMLRVNKQMRQEALPLAYRRTVFHLYDMDDLIRLLIAVGDIVTILNTGACMAEQN
ncbi:hypothetical protein BKA65DRAFT_485092 [Rhexocercosporidium sp. MPI-PUGE-AT-0058]|nr:hypothetical protein BKA65DRAFT_485092 [Rhexocercosporidium sp. MPI-PUGE-AT-0058]